MINITAFILTQDFFTLKVFKLYCVFVSFFFRVRMKNNKTLQEPLAIFCIVADKVMLYLIGKLSDIIYNGEQSKLPFYQFII